MTHKIIIHGVLLILSIIVIFLWVTDSTFSGFSLQLTGILMLILVVSRFFIKPPTFRLVESVVSTMAVLLVINDTGNLASPFFFLNFFLLFELSLLLEPAIPLVLSAALIVFYIFITTFAGDLSAFTILLAFPFMTPLAVFLGKIYKKEENQKGQIRGLSKKMKILKEK